MKVTLFVALLLITSISGVGQSRGTASALQRFEANWLHAILNQDNAWLGTFAEGKLDITPTTNSALDDRRKFILGLARGISPSESKVRISGTISVHSNEPGRARSFMFLDTFNKKAGKWEIIATSLSGPFDMPDSSRSTPAEAELTDLENAWAQSDVTNDPVILERIIAPEFVCTSATGEVRNRGNWLSARQSEHVKAGKSSDVQIHSISDSLAIVTGINVTTTSDASGHQTVNQDRFTDTWVRRTPGWQVVARQITRLD